MPLRIQLRTLLNRNVSSFLFIPLFLLFFSYPASAGGNSSRYGGKLILAATNDPKSFNDIMGKEVTTSMFTGYMFEGLTTVNAFDLKVEPNLAERWEVNKEGTVWTFFLRPGVLWSDGAPFTAEDVVFTFNDLIYNDAIPSSARDIFTIEGQIFKVEKVDDLTVRFTLPRRFAPFLRSMGQAILPKHKLKESVDRSMFTFTWGIDTPPEEIVGTGPFKLKAYHPGERVVFERNPRYWKRSDTGERLPYIDEVIYLIVQNQDTALLKFLDGEIDYYGMRGSDFPYLKPREEDKNFTVYQAGPDFGSQFLVFNQNPRMNPKTGKPYLSPEKLSWFTNLDFRRAVAHVIDKAKIIEILYNGLGYPQYSAMSPSAGFFYNPNVEHYDYSPDKARKILADAGFKDRDGDGIIEDDQGHPVKFNLYTNADPTRTQIAAIIRHDLQDLGMEVNFLPLEFNTLVTKLNATFDWDAIIIGLTGGVEPHFGKNVWHSSGQLHMWNPAQAEPATDWERRIDEIFDQGVQELDENKRKVLYDEFQQIVARELPFIYTVLGANIYAVRNTFGNLKPSSYGGAFHNLEEIYIPEEYR